MKTPRICFQRAHCWERRMMVTDQAALRQLIDAALAYRDAWRARKAFGKQFRQEPRADQVFLKATARQLDKNVTDSRRDLERVALRFVKRSVRTKKTIQEDQTQKGNRK
jgi:hypothetical protein